MLNHFFFADQVITVFVHHEERIELHCITSFEFQIILEMFLNVWFNLFIADVTCLVSVELFEPFVDNSFYKFIHICTRSDQLSKRFRLSDWFLNLLYWVCYWSRLRKIFLNWFLNDFLFLLISFIRRLKTSNLFYQIKHLEFTDCSTAIGVKIYEFRLYVDFFNFFTLRNEISFNKWARIDLVKVADFLFIKQLKPLVNLIPYLILLNRNSLCRLLIYFNILSL